MLVEAFHGNCIIFLVQTHDQFTVNLFRRHRSSCFFKTLAETADQRRGRSIVLQTPHRPTGTPLSVCNQRHVSKFGTPVCITAEQLSVDQYRTADSGSHGYKHDVTTTFSGTESHFSQSHHVRIVPDANRQSAFLLYDVSQRQVFPSGKILSAAQHPASRFVHNAWSPDADAFNTDAEIGRRISRIPYSLADLSRYRFGRNVSIRGQTPLAVKRPFVVNQGIFHGRAAQINSDYISLFHTNSIKHVPPISEN